MDSIRIDRIGELLETLNSFPNHFIYRGHADSIWKLESGMERVLGANWNGDLAAKHEDFFLDYFKSRFHLYDRENIYPESKLSWLSLMQHYGAPTRLLDFSESAYVALYFALEACDPHSDADLAVFAIDYSAIMDRSIQYIQTRDSSFKENRLSVHEKRDEVFDEIVDRFSYDILWLAEPRKLNARLDRQAGSFLLSGNRALRIEDALALPLYGDVQMKKIVVAKDLYEGVFAFLRKVNITSASLYGDLNGLGRAIRMQMQAYSR